MKLHIRTDRRGMVHSLTATHAAEADIKQLPHLLHGEESVVYGDQAYWNEADRQAFEAINRARSRTRARCEDPVRVVKKLWGFEKTRYRGMAKNLAGAQMMSALANLYAVRHRLTPQEATCAL